MMAPRRRGRNSAASPREGRRPEHGRDAIRYSPLFVVVHFGLHSHNISLKTTRMLSTLGREWEYGTMLSADEGNGSAQRDVENRM